MCPQVLLLALEDLQTTIGVLSQQSSILTMNRQVPEISLLNSQPRRLSQAGYHRPSVTDFRSKKDRAQSQVSII